MACHWPSTPRLLRLAPGSSDNGEYIIGVMRMRCRVGSPSRIDYSSSRTAGCQDQGSSRESEALINHQPSAIFQTAESFRGLALFFPSDSRRHRNRASKIFLAGRHRTYCLAQLRSSLSTLSGFSLAPGWIYIANKRRSFAALRITGLDMRLVNAARPKSRFNERRRKEGAENVYSMCHQPRLG